MTKQQNGPKKSAVKKLSGALLALLLVSGAAQAAPLLMGFYPLDGNGMDPTGNGPALTASGAITYVPGLSGQAASFDGASWLTANIDSSGDTVPNFSWGSWVKLDDPSAWNIFLSNDNNGWDRFTQSYGGAWSVSNGGVQQSNTATTGDWTYVAQTFDGATQNLYVDGVLALTTSDAMHDSAHFITIGINANGVSPLTGLMQSVYFFEGTLTADQETTIYNGGASGAGVLEVAGLAPSAVPEVAGLAPSAVPEPGTYALVLSALGVLGFTSRRRRTL